MDELVLENVPGRFAILRLPARTALPGWFESVPGFSMVVRSDTETALLVTEEGAPADFEGDREGGWCGLFVRGTLDFGLVGILAGLSGALAAEGIALLAVSTFDTDWLFVKAEQLERARRALLGRGWSVVDAGS